MSEQTLYRYWNGEQLLYVGISINAYTRAKQHKENSKWWPEATHVTFEEFPNRYSVEQAEKAAIKAEKPLYNIMHNNTDGVVVTSQSPKSPLVGLWGFDLIKETDTVDKLSYPGRVYQIKSFIEGESYLIEFFEVSFSVIQSSLGMSICKLSELVNAHLFSTRPEMVAEFNSWWRDYNFWSNRRTVDSGKSVEVSA